MINQSLLFLLETILGKGKSTSNDNYAFKCPNNCHSIKPKLEVNLVSQQYHCWVCGSQKGGYKGKTLLSLFKKVKAPSNKIEELNALVRPNSKYYTPSQEKVRIELPKEFIPLSDHKTGYLINRALTYLKNRGVSSQDILKYNIGYCSEGEYDDRIIIPSYNKDGELNYFIARSINDNAYNKYKNPKISKDIIFNELFINWNTNIILCEGAFDSIAIKRNVIPLLGKEISNELMKKLITSGVKKIYIALDQDALKSALYHAEKLMNIGKEVYLIELKGKDPSSIGFQQFTEITHETYPLTYTDLIKKKINL